MKKIFCTFLLITIVLFASSGQIPETVKPVKNVIVMLADGASQGVISAARWYKMYNKMGNNLYLDPYFCGTVSSFCSNAPIGDSAPTMSCYMTGIPSLSSYVSLYPVADPENDLVPIDPLMAYQPLATLLEAARIVQKKSVGIVATCEFPHATPAACAAHHYDRGNYKHIASQMVYNDLDVMFAGGARIINDDMKTYFKTNGTNLIQDDITTFRNYNGSEKVWALFEKMSMPNDLDRDPDKTPSLEEMTAKAIEHLSKNKNGFFLMVEGSKIDWAAHPNDATGCITEFIAFDNAAGVALDFARKNKETVVVILADHCTGGLTIGRNGRANSSLSLEELFSAVSQYKKTAAGLESIIQDTQPNDIPAVFAKYTEIELSEKELENILHSMNYRIGEYAHIRTTGSLTNIIAEIMNQRTCFGFASGTHTAEEVFLAVYHPSGIRPTGFVTNMQINDYLCKAMGLKTSLPELNRKIFVNHKQALGDLKYEITENDDFPTLTVTNGNNTLTITAFSSMAMLNGKPVNLGSVTVYIDKNKTFYFPADILKML